MPPCLLTHAPDPRARLLDEGDPVEEVGNERIASHAAGAKLCPAQSSWQTSWVADLDPVVVDLDEDVRTRLEVVPVHNGYKASKVFTTNTFFCPVKALATL